MVIQKMNKSLKSAQQLKLEKYKFLDGQQYNKIHD